MNLNRLIPILLLAASFSVLVNCMKAQEDLFVLTKVADGLEFPEGPAWDGKQNLYFSNCTGSWIGVYSASGMDTFIAKNKYPEIFGKTNGLTFGKDGNLYACEYGKGTILQITPSGEVTTFLSGYAGKSFNRPNDIAFNSAGDLLFTDPKSYNPENRDGVVYRYSNSSKQISPVITGIAFPNGLAFSGDEKYLFVCESAMNRVLKFTMLKDSILSEPEVFIELPGGDPDGIALDVKGNLYVAHFGGGMVYKIDPQGKIIQKIELPGKKPTNLEFAGPDMRTLFITEVETNALYMLRTDIAGQKLHNSP